MVQAREIRGTSDRLGETTKQQKTESPRRKPFEVLNRDLRRQLLKNSPSDPAKRNAAFQMRLSFGCSGRFDVELVGIANSFGSVGELPRALAASSPASTLRLNLNEGIQRFYRANHRKR